MFRRIFILCIVALGLCALSVQAKEAAPAADSLKASTPQAEATDSDFVRAYVLTISEGKAFYSVYGHAALRLVCPSKNLDYCFTFEMNMHESSYPDVFTRKAKAGFTAVPSKQFLAAYQQEGRGVKAYELNLSPVQKQTLWKVLDEECAKGPAWTFDYTSVNCTSMVMYAINKAIAPEQIDLGTLPAEATGGLTDWEDYVSRRSPWVRLIMRSVLLGVDESETHSEDLLTPEMLMLVFPQARLVSAQGYRPLTKGQPAVLSQQTCTDAPFWLRPWMVGMVLVIGIVASCVVAVRHKKQKKEITNNR